MTVRVPIVDRRAHQAPDAPAPPAAPRGEQAGAGEATSAARIPETEGGFRAETEALRAERDEWKERCLRTAAELENLRKLIPQRVDEEVFHRERERLERWLDLGDALARALAQLGCVPGQWASGVCEVAKLFEDLLAKSGVRRIQQVDTFDPALHEALAVVRDPTRPDGAIVEVSRSGWTLDDRLLRPAGVVVVRNEGA
jgi:molecular chaperone GrpE